MHGHTCTDGTVLRGKPWLAHDLSWGQWYWIVGMGTNLGHWTLSMKHLQLNISTKQKLDVAPIFQATATNKRSQEVPATFQSISLLGFLDASSGKPVFLTCCLFKWTVNMQFLGPTMFGNLRHANTSQLVKKNVTVALYRSEFHKNYLEATGAIAWQNAFRSIQMLGLLLFRC